MPSNAVLVELELMPLWQWRGTPSVSAASVFSLFTAITVSTAQGVSGWALTSRPLGGEEETLFLNLLVAMKLGRGQHVRVDHADLREEAARCKISWLWLIGEDTASRLDVVPLTAATKPMWKDLPVFVSVHPAELLAQPELKGELWADWCRYSA